ncbi:MAG: TonB C-terminal domain-containing protein [Candidatus Midichloria sp.]|nr:TonB C-terminal domain-containing protein [Candidatus Midichloria sp.]
MTTNFSNSLAYSLVLHAVLFVFLILGLPSLKKDNFKEQAIVIDLVSVSEITNIKPKKQSAPQPQLKPADSFQEKPKPAAPIETPPLPIIAKNDPAEEMVKKEKKPEEKVPEVKHEEKKIASQEKPSPKQPPKKETVKKSVEVRQDLKNSDKKKDSHSKMVLKSLKVTNKPQPEKKILDKKFQELEKIIEGEADEPFNPDLEISISEIDSIRNQIKRAWNPIAFNGSRQVMKVSIFMQLDKSGTIISIKPILESNHNPSYHAFVESVIRAARKASPLQDLAPNKFQSWKEMEMVFSSEDMIY